MTKRRNLSGMYIFEKFEDEEKREPTCFEDCTEATQRKWLENKNPEFLMNVALNLAKSLREIGDEFDIISE